MFVHVWSPLRCDFFFNWWISCGLFDFMGQDAGTFRCSFLAWLCGCQCPEEAVPGLSSYPASIPKDEALSQRPECASSFPRLSQDWYLDSPPCRPFRVRGTVTQMRRVQSRKEESGWSAIERALPRHRARPPRVLWPGSTPCPGSHEPDLPRPRWPGQQLHSRLTDLEAGAPGISRLGCFSGLLSLVWIYRLPLCLLLISS